MISKHFTYYGCNHIIADCDNCPFDNVIDHDADVDCHLRRRSQYRVRKCYPRLMSPSGQLVLRYE